MSTLGGCTAEARGSDDGGQEEGVLVCSDPGPDAAATTRLLVPVQGPEVLQQEPATNRH